ncbi:MAG: hypothetical protein KFW07_02680 [Mycoplasmataceae bacterium]|nr:hypothetical protein [Mycoplasmataceae bacterium]
MSKKNIKSIIKSKINMNNIFFVSFFVFASIAIILGISFGTKREWYDVTSIVSIFYIGCPILILIFTINEKSFIRKTLSLFKFKEYSDSKKQKLTPQEEIKLKIFNVDLKDDSHTPKKNGDLIFISIFLISYGVLLLMISIPSLIMFVS